MNETITWISVDDELPDEGLLVMIHAKHWTEPVWIGFLSEGQWRLDDAMPFESPTHWAEMLKGPQA